MDAGFFRGTSADQDNRFVNKQKKLMKSMKFAENIDAKVDMKKVNLETLKPWIHERVTDMLTFEDDVVVAYIYNSLEEQFPDPKTLQINLTGFLNGKNSRMFMGELWKLLISAQQSPHGIPEELINQKKEDIRKRQIEVEKIAELKNLLPKIEVKEEPREAERSSRRRRRSRSTSRDRHRRSRSRENRHRRSRSRDRRRSSRDRYTSSSRHRSSRRRRRSDSRERVTSRSRHHEKRRHDDRVSKEDAKKADETRKDSSSDGRHHGNSGSGRKYGLNVSKASTGDDKMTSQKENGEKKRDYDACPVDPWARAPRHGQTNENRGRHATDASVVARSKKVEKAPASDEEEKWEEKKSDEKSKRASSSVTSSSDQNSDVEERRERKRKSSKVKEKKSKKIRVEDRESSSSEEQVEKTSRKKKSDKSKVCFVIFSSSSSLI